MKANCEQKTTFVPGSGLEDFNDTILNNVRLRSGRRRGGGRGKVRIDFLDNNISEDEALNRAIALSKTGPQDDYIIHQSWPPERPPSLNQGGLVNFQPSDHYRPSPGAYERIRDEDESELSWGDVALAAALPAGLVSCLVFGWLADHPQIFKLPPGQVLDIFAHAVGLK